jgi:hypothetical protein
LAIKRVISNLDRRPPAAPINCLYYQLRRPVRYIISLHIYIISRIHIIIRSSEVHFHFFRIPATRVARTGPVSKVRSYVHNMAKASAVKSVYSVKSAGRGGPGLLALPCWARPFSVGRAAH